MKRAIRIIGSVVALLVIGVLSSHHGSTTPSLSEYEAKEEQFKNHVLQNLWKDGSPKANENRAIFLACLDTGKFPSECFKSTMNVSVMRACDKFRRDPNSTPVEIRTDVANVCAKLEH